MKYKGINNEGLEKLIDKMYNEKDFAEQLLSKSSMEEMYNFAYSQISGYNFEEFQDVMKKLFISSTKKLTDEETAHINGGVDASVILAGVKGFWQAGGLANFRTLYSKLFPANPDETKNNQQ